MGGGRLLVGATILLMINRNALWSSNSLLLGVTQTYSSAMERVVCPCFQWWSLLGVLLICVVWATP